MNTDTQTSTDDRHPLMERVELINHLLKFSDRLFAIMSADPQELTAFARMLMEESRVGLHFAHVRPEMALTAEDVAVDLAKAWGIEVDFDELASGAIEQRLAGLIPEPRRAVAVIEDVERLPRSALEDLVTFMQRMDSTTGGRVRLVLMGGPSLAHRLQGLECLNEGGQVYALHLGGGSSHAMHEETTAPDAEHAWASMDSAFDPEGQHSGLPGRTLLIAGLALSLVLAIAMALLLRPDAPEAPEDRRVSIPLQSAKPDVATASRTPAFESPAPQTGHEIAAPAPTAPFPVIGEAVVTEPLKDEPLPATPTPAAPPLGEPTQPEETRAPAPKVMTHHAAGEAYANRLMTLTEPPKPPATPPAKSETAPRAKPAATETGKPAKTPGNWFASQPGTSYVIQVMSVKSVKDMAPFIRHHGLKDCHSFTQKRDGQTLHTLTCGLYESRDAAAKAASALPEKARASSPYPRRVDDIRKIMMP